MSTSDQQVQHVIMNTDMDNVNRTYDAITSGL